MIYDDRKRDDVERLLAAWRQAPCLRLGQVIAAGTWLVSRDYDPSDVHDGELLAACEDYVREADLSSAFEGVV